MPRLLQHEINRRCDYHKPSELTIEGHTRVRAFFKDAMEVLNAELPDGRETALVLTKLEEAQMWAHAAIARSQVEGM